MRIADALEEIAATPQRKQLYTLHCRRRVGCPRACRQSRRRSSFGLRDKQVMVWRHVLSFKRRALLRRKHALRDPQAGAPAQDLPAELAEPQLT